MLQAEVNRIGHQPAALTQELPLVMKERLATEAGIQSALLKTLVISSEIDSKRAFTKLGIQSITIGLPETSRAPLPTPQEPISNWQSTAGKRDKGVPGKYFSVLGTFVISDAGNVAIRTVDRSGSVEHLLLREIDSKSAASLKELEGIEVASLVRIEPSDRLRQDAYTISLHPEILVPPVNPDRSVLKKLPSQAVVGLEGEVVENAVGQLTLKIQEGTEEKPKKRLVAIKADTFDPKFTSGVLENLAGKSIRVGDRIRTTAFVGEKNTLEFDNNPAFLVEPSAVRATEYQATEKAVKEILQSCRSFLGNQDTIRGTDGRLDTGQFAYSLNPEKDKKTLEQDAAVRAQRAAQARMLLVSLDRFELTAQARQERRHIMSLFQPDELPVLPRNAQEREGIALLNQYYFDHDGGETRVEAMSREELITDLLDVLTTEEKWPPLNVIKNIVDAQFGKENKVFPNLLRRAISARHEQFAENGSLNAAVFLHDALPFVVEFDTPEDTRRVFETLDVAMHAHLVSKTGNGPDIMPLVFTSAYVLNKLVNEGSNDNILGLKKVKYRLKADMQLLPQTEEESTDAEWAARNSLAAITHIIDLLDPLVKAEVDEQTKELVIAAYKKGRDDERRYHENGLGNITNGEIVFIAEPNPDVLVQAAEGLRRDINGADPRGAAEALRQRTARWAHGAQRARAEVGEVADQDPYKKGDIVESTANGKTDAGLPKRVRPDKQSAQ